MENLFLSQEQIKQLELCLPSKTLNFVLFHGFQLQTMGINFSDTHLLENLFCKLESQIFDAGSKFQIIDD